MQVSPICPQAHPLGPVYKMVVSPQDCFGHQLRVDLRAKIERKKMAPVKQVDKTKKIYIKRGGGQGGQIDLEDLRDEFKKTEEWKRVEKGGGLVVPNVELRMKRLPKPDTAGKRNFNKQASKKKFTEIEKYSMDWTDNRLQTYIQEHYDQLKKDGKSEIEARTEIHKMPEYLALKSWMDEKAEVTTKEAIEKGMNLAKRPYALFRSINKEDIASEKHPPRLGNFTALKELGLKLPEGESETDLMCATATGDVTGLTLLEVKRQDTPPWKPNGRAPEKSNACKAVDQLARGHEFFSSLLGDLPPDKVIFHVVSAFPDAPVQELEQVFCPSCLTQIIGKEDLQDWDQLKKKLSLPDPALAPTATGLDHLLTVCARLSGPHSLLHAGCRTIVQKKQVEDERMADNVAVVDEKIIQGQYVLASPSQKRDIAQFIQSGKKHATLSGPPGSGKTVELIVLTKSLVRRAKAQGEQVLLVVVTTAGPYPKAELNSHLDTETAGLGADIRLHFTDITSLMQGLKLDPNQFKTGETSAGGSPVFDTPAVLQAAAHAAVRDYPDYEVIFCVDEAVGGAAPQRCDWRGLEEDRLPDSVSLLIVFNPGYTYKPLLLPASAAYLHISGDLRYRSSLSIAALYDCVAKHMTVGAPVTSLGEVATDVRGDLPRLTLLGECSNLARLKAAITGAREALGDQATVIYDVTVLSPQTILEIQNYVSWPGWTVMKGGDMAGSEDNALLVIGPGYLEAVSRARVKMAVILAWDRRENKELYDRNLPGYMEAVKQGLVQHVPVPPVTVSSVAEAATFTAAKDVSVIGFFPDQTTAPAKAFLAVASRDGQLAITSSPEVAALHQVADETVLLLKNFDKGRAEMPGVITEEAVEKFVLSENEIKSYIIFFLNPQSESFADNVAVIDDIEKENRGRMMKIFTHNTDNADSKWVFEQYNITDTEVPTFRAESEDGDIFKPDDETMETDNVKKFVNDFFTGKLQAQKRKEKETSEKGEENGKEVEEDEEGDEEEEGGKESEGEEDE